MVKLDKRITAKGIVKTQVRVVESYRPSAGLSPRQRTIRDFGILEEQPDREAFMAMVRAFNASYRKENAPLRIEASGTAKMYSGSNQTLNYGYKYLACIYDALGISEFIRAYEQESGSRSKRPTADIFKFLVLLRILNPDSKRGSCQIKNGFYDMDTQFTLAQVYRSLDSCAGFEVELQRHLNERVKERIGRDLSYAFFDVTNYFFEIDFPEDEEDLRQKGVSKEHRCDPIAAMGLFMDGNGLPVSMSVFPGNTSDTKTLQPVMKDIKASYGLGRIVVVADKGLNSSDNINAIVNNGDGYIFSQILKGKKGQRFDAELFSEKGWVVKSQEYRCKVFEEAYSGLDREGKKVIRKRKVLLYWDKADADMARRKREVKLSKAEKAIGNNAYGIKHGYEEYTKEDIVDKHSGECLQDIAKVRRVNTEKAEKDARYDGYFCIITSELDYDEAQIRKAYHGLWKIEDSFRIMKSDLYARPVFVRKNEHIRAHFLVCFVALLILRIVQHQMGKRALSAERIARALNAATCRAHKGGVIQLDDVGGAIAFKKRTDKTGKVVDTLEYSGEDEIAQDYKRIQETFGTGFYDVFARVETFNKFLKSIALASRR
jgi:transposase